MSEKLVGIGKKKEKKRKGKRGEFRFGSLVRFNDLVHWFDLLV